MKKYLFALALLSLTAGAKGPAKGPSSSSCSQFVQKFYDWYASIASDSKRKGEPWNLALKEKGEDFVPALAQALKDDSAAQSKSPHEIVGIDWDPFLNSQDPAPKYVVEKVVVEGNKCHADVRGIDPTAQKRTGPDVSPELVFEKAHWKFADFLNKDFKEPNSLQDVLKSLRKSRDTK